MSVILTPFAKLILLFYNLTGSYGISLILFCLTIRLILFPIFLMGRKSSLSMTSLNEEQKKLQQKYGRDREKYSMALQELYAREGVKPSSGCLWSFLPLPFLMALYAIIRQPLTYLMNMSSDQFSAVSNFLYGEVMNYKNGQLSIAQDVFLRYDDIIKAVPDLAGMERIDFTFLGLNLSSTPQLMFWKLDDWASWQNIGLFLIPFVSAGLGLLTTLVTNYINGKVLGTTRTMDGNTRTMLLIMPLFSLWLCFTLPAGLGVYWIANSLFAICQEFANIPFLRKYLKKKEEEKAKRAEEDKLRVKREKLAQAEAKKKAAEEMRRIQMERKLNKSIVSDSRVGIRAYARGRLYDSERYPTTPYRDPNEIAREQFAAAAAAEEARKQAKGKKKADLTAPAPTVESAPEESTVPVAEEPMVSPQVAEEATLSVPETAPLQEESPEEEGFVEESFVEETEETKE